ncbi:hypothetical protein ACFL0P_00560 [Candidatus Omnitrophota bacterium]
MKKILLTLAMVLLATSLAHAADDIMFEKDAFYDIIYVISASKLEVVERVRILGVEKIGDESFLVIEAMGSKKGYIKFRSIKSILSHGSFQRHPMGKENR